MTKPIVNAFSKDYVPQISLPRDVKVVRRLKDVPTHQHIVLASKDEAKAAKLAKNSRV